MMKVLVVLFLGIVCLVNGQMKRYGSGWNTGSYGKLGGTITTTNKGPCKTCPPKKEDVSLCKTINVQNKWVVDAANCVSYCVRISNENSGGYCKQNMCYCSKIEKPPVVTSLCETIKVNGKWVVDASGCVSKCVHSSAENSGGYCTNNNCFCQKREIPKPIHPIVPKPTLCEAVYVNGKWMTDEKSCEAHCVFTSHENIGGYCKAETCFCKQREIPKPSLCESVYVNGKWMLDESTCSAHCVHTSHDNVGGYCKADTCYCKQAEKEKSLCDTVNINGKWITDSSGCSSYCLQTSHDNSGGYCQHDTCYCNKASYKKDMKPLCQQVKMNYKWITDSSGCTNYCVQSTNGMKRIGYCQNNNCYCK